MIWTRFFLVGISRRTARLCKNMYKSEADAELVDRCKVCDVNGVVEQPNGAVNDNDSNMTHAVLRNVI